MPPVERLHNEGVAVETRDVPLGLVGALAGGLAAFVAVSIVALMIGYPGALRGASDAPKEATAKPRLEIAPAADRTDFRAAQDRDLAGYGWIDRQRGIVHIPIDKAMRDVATGGIADWPGAKK